MRVTMYYAYKLCIMRIIPPPSPGETGGNQKSPVWPLAPPTPLRGDNKHILGGDDKERGERKALHSLRRLTIWSYDTGDQHWGGAADNKAIHPMLRSHENQFVSSPR